MHFACQGAFLGYGLHVGLCLFGWISSLKAGEQCGDCWGFGFFSFDSLGFLVLEMPILSPFAGFHFLCLRVAWIARVKC